MCVCVDETHSASSRIQQELLTVLLIQKALVKLTCMCLGKGGEKNENISCIKTSIVNANSFT